MTSPLYEAIVAGRDVQELLAAGHTPNVYADFPGVRWTPLHLAVYRCLPEVAEKLLDALANPNSATLPAPLAGPYESLVGMTPVDLAAALDEEALIRLLVRRGGRPGGRVHSPVLRSELAVARTVDVAESFVVEPVLLPLVEKAQQQAEWDEADRLLLRILRQEGEGERSLHLRIRGLLARGKREEALEEASLVFLRYRRQGRYREALQVARCMRQIDADSARPYELEMEFLTALGWFEEARRALAALMSLYRRQELWRDMASAQTRFQILCRRPENRGRSRPPVAWTAPDSMPISSGNLPALVEEETPEWFGELRRLWWGEEEWEVR